MLLSHSYFGGSVHKKRYTIDTSVICNASSPLNDLSSVKTLGKLEFEVLIFNELRGKKEVVPMMAYILDMPLNIIIGKPTIKEHKL